MFLIELKPQWVQLLPVQVRDLTFEMLGFTLKKKKLTDTTGTVADVNLCEAGARFGSPHARPGEHSTLG